MSDVLVVVAHPDDESLFAGGYISSLAQRGGVHIAACADGVLSRWYGKGRGWDVEKRDARNRRESQFMTACSILGATGCVQRMFDDQMSDVVPQLAINTDVAAVVARRQPVIVLTHHVGDLNVDHRRVAEAVLVATRGMDIKILCMTPEWPTRCVGPAWAPTVHYPLSPEMLERKVQACLCYEDELRPWPHPRSERYIREHPDEWFMEVR